MKKRFAAAVALFLSAGMPAVAHRLDEYLQAAIISLERSQLHVELRLTPGIAVFPVVLATMDSNGDGVISESEQRAYAARVLREISLSSDGERVTPRMIAAQFPTIEEMKDGRGEILLQFDARLRGGGVRRGLTFENHHLSRISAYLVNSVVPRDPEIRIVAQNRDSSQSVYHLDYTVAGGGSDWGAWGGLGALSLLLFVRVAFFRRGLNLPA